jgi:hypothetical protein
LRESLADHPSRSLCLLDSADYYERIHPVVPNAIALGHIVPWGAFSKRTLVVRDAISDAKTALRKAGVGLNESWNGFWTDSPRHLGTHTDIFFLTLGERLRGKQNRLEVLNILGILRDDILDGMFI